MFDNRFISNFTKYKFLLVELVKRDIKGKYKDSVLGLFWSFLNPLLTMVVLTFIFSYVFKMSIKNFPVDRYFDESVRETNFWETPVIKYHRTLETYIEALIKNGFTIQHLVEPTPPDSMLDIPGMKDEFRRPMMMILSARKL